MARTALTYTVKLDAATAKRLRLIAQSRGISPEVLIAEITAECIDPRWGAASHEVAETRASFDHEERPFPFGGYRESDDGQPPWSAAEPPRTFDQDDGRSLREQAQIALDEYDRTGISYSLEDVLAAVRADLERRLAEEA